MNECHFIGNFVRDPEVKQFSTGNRKARFTLAIHKRYKTKDGTWENGAVFIDFEAWNGTADTIEKHFKKGDLIIISSASVDQDTWEHEGQKRSRVYFRVNGFEFPPNSKKKEENREPVAAATDDGSDIPF